MESIGAVRSRGDYRDRLPAGPRDEWRRDFVTGRIAGGRERVLGSREMRTGRPRRVQVAAGPGMPARIDRAGLAAKIVRASPAAVPLVGGKPHRFHPWTLAFQWRPAWRLSVALGGDCRGNWLWSESARQRFPFEDAAERAFIHAGEFDVGRSAVERGPDGRAYGQAHRGPNYRLFRGSQLRFSSFAGRTSGVNLRGASGA